MPGHGLDVGTILVGNTDNAMPLYHLHSGSLSALSQLTLTLHPLFHVYTSPRATLNTALAL